MNQLILITNVGKEIASWLKENKGKYEATSPFIQRDDEGRPQRRESNIYASIVHKNGRAAHRTAHPDDVVIHYWNENYRAPPIQPSTLASSSASVSKQSSGDVEESMYLNPLYSGSEKESEQST